MRKEKEEGFFFWQYNAPTPTFFFFFKERTQCSKSQLNISIFSPFPFSFVLTVLFNPKVKWIDLFGQLSYSFISFFTCLFHIKIILKNEIFFFSFNTLLESGKLFFPSMLLPNTLETKCECSRTMLISFKCVKCSSLRKNSSFRTVCSATL